MKAEIIPAEPVTHTLAVDMTEAEIYSLQDILQTVINCNVRLSPDQYDEVKIILAALIEFTDRLT